MFLISFLLLIVSTVTYCFVRAFLSPINHVPGPWLAKLTYWYEFYYDVVLVGRYTFKIRELHEQYGPIIQINPHEIHISDPDFYPTLYSGPSQKRNKWGFMVNAFNLSDATFATVGHDEHRIRRSALNPFFGKAKVRSLQPALEKNINRLLNRVDGFAKSSEPMNLTLAFTALTNDIAEEYAFGKHGNRVEAPDFDPSFYYAGEAAAKMAGFVKQFRWILAFMSTLPDSVVIKMNPTLGVYVVFQGQVKAQVKNIMKSHADPDQKRPERPTIFHEILNANIPTEQKRYSRLWQDGQITIVAGTVTTSSALAYTLFYLLSQPNDLRRLKEELVEAMPDPENCPPLAKLESLPFLTACIKECLRLSNGVTTRLQRIDPEKPMIFTDNFRHKGKKYVLPAGTPVGMTAMLMHWDPKIFENPHIFSPDRWLSLSSEKKEKLEMKSAPVDDQGKTVISSTAHPLDRYLQPFSAGTRQCIGMNLAYAELYLTLAKLLRVYGSAEVRFPGDKGYMELHETTYKQDLEIVGDGLTPIFREGSRGVRVKVH